MKYKSFIKKTIKPDTEEGQFAEQFGLEIQRLGFRILCGAVPLLPVLSVYSVTILEDWSYCKIHIEKVIRKKSPLPFDIKPEFSEIDWSRRHGEWLACIAAVYLYKRSSGKKVSRLVALAGEIDKLRVRARLLIEAERHSMFIDPRLCREVDLILELSEDPFDERIKYDKGSF